MDKTTLEKANILVKTIDELDNLNFVMCVPYPQFSSNDRNVNSALFDEQTLGELKTTIKDFIDKRQRELINEFESL